MATISHPAFRILLEKFGGCHEYFTEMINAGTLITGGQFEKFYIDPAPVPQKVVWQLTGKNCEHMVQAAKILVELPGIGIEYGLFCTGYIPFWQWNCLDDKAYRRNRRNGTGSR